jgi:hypothetical protein
MRRGGPPELLAPDLRTVFTPHLGSAVGEVRRAIARSAAQSILDFLGGRPPSHAVNHPASGRRARLSPGGRPGSSAMISESDDRMSKIE